MAILHQTVLPKVQDCIWVIEILVVRWLNILLSAYTIITQVITLFGTDLETALTILSNYYITGLIFVVPPIIFAVVMLPIIEDFAVVFYKKTFDALTQARSKIRALNMRQSLVNVISGAGTGFIAAIAFVGAVIATTMNYSNGIFLFPRQLGNSVKIAITTAPNFSAMVSPLIWTLMMLGIPLAFMLLVGIFSHLVRRRIGGGIETFAFFAGVTISMVVYMIVTGMDYVLGAFPCSVNYSGEIFNRLVPYPELPKETDFVWRLASQFVINLALLYS